MLLGRSRMCPLTTRASADPRPKLPCGPFDPWSTRADAPTFLTHRAPRRSRRPYTSRTRTPGKYSARRARSPESPVRTTSPREAADAMTTASAVVADAMAANASPAMRARQSLMGSMSIAPRMASRRSVRPRHHSATTATGTVTGRHRACAPEKPQHPVASSLVRDQSPGVERNPRAHAALRLAFFGLGVPASSAATESSAAGRELGGAELVEHRPERLVVTQDARAFGDRSREVATV